MKFDMRHIGSLLQDAISRAQIGTQIEAARVVAAADAAIKDLFPNDAPQVRVLSVKNKVLTISCTNAPLAQEIKMREKPITEKIAEIVGDAAVDRIRYLL